MKTVREWFEECLPEDIREKAIANTINSYHSSGYLYYSTCNTFHAALLSSFIFSYSPEGGDYWDDVLMRYSLEFRPEDPFK